MLDEKTLLTRRRCFFVLFN